MKNHQTTIIEVQGTPAPQGSKRHIGGGRMIEANKNLPAWRAAVQKAAQQAHTGDPYDGPIHVTVDFFLTKPKNPRWQVPATGYDLDKLQRAIGDALEKAKVITNDARITRWEAQKWYPAGGKPTGAIITVTQAGPRTPQMD